MHCRSSKQRKSAQRRNALRKLQDKARAIVFKVMAEVHAEMLDEVVAKGDRFLAYVLSNRVH